MHGNQRYARTKVASHASNGLGKNDRLAAEFLNNINDNENHGGVLGAVGKRLSLTDPVTILVIMIMDALAVFSASILAWYGYHYFSGTPLPEMGLYVRAGAFLAGIFLLRGTVETIYGPLWGVTRQLAILKTLTQYTQAFLLFVTILVMFRWSQTYSRGSLVAQYLICGAAVLALRSFQFQIVHNSRWRQFFVANRVILVGDAMEIDATRRRWQERGENFAVLKSYPLLLDDGTPETPDYLAAFAEVVVRMSRASKPDRIVILLPFERTKEINFLVQRFSELPTSILVSTEQLAATQMKPELLKFGGVSMLRVVRKPLTGTDRVLKRCMDFTASAALLLLLSPLLVATAVAIRLESPGPALFRQRRKGFNQQQFNIYKFRTMQITPKGEAFRQTAKNDSRITRVGKFLRRWNIDELPQLLNVLRGEMSLVGPRPHAIEHDDMYYLEIASYARRHNIKPGITGLAQALGFRGATDTLKQMEDRVNYDLLYIQDWSILLDLKIMVMTVFSSRAYKNAY